MDSSICEITSLNDVIRSVTDKYLNSVQLGQLSAAKIEADLLDEMKQVFELHNSTADKGQKWRLPDALYPYQIAMAINRKFNVALINLGNQSNSQDFMPLAIYVDNKDDARYGTYTMDRTYLSRIVREFHYTIRSSEIEEVFKALRDIVKVLNRTTDRDLIPAKNCVFNYKTKEVSEFSPTYVFIAKLPVNYSGQIALKTFTNDDGTVWNIEDWIKSLSDNPEVVASIWEMLSAVVRPNVRWNMAAWLYGTGNNGKGCLTQLCRSLVGYGNCASIPLASMSKDFSLEPLIRSIAVIVDENDDDYIDNAANLKTIITGDVLDIDVKFKNPIQLQPRVFMIQCMNSMPRSSSKADGFYRRQLFIPLDKCFDKCENKRIKQEYLLDEEVLEYILWKVLNTDFYEFTETPVVAQTVENHYRWAEAKFKRNVKDATDKKISSHVARHTFCTLRVKEGMQPVTLQKIMGHNSIRTTLGWYTHLEEGDIITEAIELMKNDKSVVKYEG